MAKMISYAVAKEAFDKLLQQIPGGPNYAELRGALRLVEVNGPKKGKAAYAIHIPTKGRRVKQIDVSSTIITVIAKKGKRRAAPDVALLELHGPWTADTIPFWPLKSEATITQRKSTRRSVEHLAKDQKKKLPMLLRRFKDLGRKIKPYEPGNPGRIKRTAKAVPDLAMQALSLEFGGSGVKSKPVFRKVFGSIKGSIGSLTKRFAQIKDAMTDPDSKVYRNWPKKMDNISVGQAKSFAGFQKRLGF